MAITIPSAFGGGIDERLQLFPLMDELADLPHQGLMAVDHRLGVGAVVVETGGSHLRLDVANRRLALGDSPLERLDARLTRLRRPRPLARLPVGLFPVFARLRLFEREAVNPGRGSRAVDPSRRWFRRSTGRAALPFTPVPVPPIPAIGPFRMLFAVEKLGVRSWIDHGVAAANLDDLRRESFDEIAV